MAENKILNSEFRNSLYKSLIEAGYALTEARDIVGKKFFVALKESLLGKLNDAVKQISEDNFDVKFDAEGIEEGIAELEKMKTFLSPTAKPKTT